MSDSPSISNQRSKRRLVVLSSLFGTILLLLVLLIVAERRSPQISDQGLNAPKHEIFRVDIDRIIAVSLVGRGRDQPLIMWRRESGWEIDRVSTAIPISQYRINDILYSFGSLHAERVIEEAPENRSQFGLDPPSVTAVATLDDQSTIKVFLGNLTPTGSTWYLMADGREQVYSVRASHGKHYHYTLEDLRADTFPTIDYNAVNYLLLKGLNTSYWEIVETNPVDTRFTNLITRFALTEPYVFPRAINNNALDKLLSLVAELEIDRVVTDSPSSLAEYGLLNPRFELIIRDTAGNTMELLVGDQTEEEVFIKFADRGTIYATPISNTSFLDVSAFELTDKFILILNIDVVDAIEIQHSNGKNRLAIERVVSGDSVVELFSVDDVQAEDKLFRKLYQLFIGLLADGELPIADRQSVLSVKPEVQIHYFTNTPKVSEISITLSPYNRQFYAAIRDGVPEFLVSREQVDRLLQGLINYMTTSD